MASTSGYRVADTPAPTPPEQIEAENAFDSLQQIVHLTSRDDYFATMLAQGGSLGLGDKARFDHSTGKWHIWNGVRWAPDRVDQIYDLVRDRLYLWMGSKKINPDSDSAKVFATLMNTAKKKSVLEALRSMPGIAMSGDEWDQHPTLMGFNNGVLDLETLTLETAPDPALHISRSTGFDWDPNADGSLFMDFIEDITSHDADVAIYLLRVLGYAMIGTNREQKFWMWVGGGSNGKGILARTVVKAMGDYAYSPPDTLYMRGKFGAASSNTPRPDLLKLQGARFTPMSEPQGGQFNEELLKAHSGNDPVEARTLHSAKYKSFLPTHKIIFLTNEMPKTDDVGPSMQRRARVIRFLEDYGPEARNADGTLRADNTLEPRLQEPDALKGALYVMATQAFHYLKTSSLPEPKQVTGWSRAYIADNDPISSFIEALCVEEAQAECQSGALYKAFDAFCSQNGYESMSLNAFGRAMQARYPRKLKTSGSFYTGIRLKNLTDTASEKADEQADGEANDEA